MVKIKVCGITNLEDALAAVEFGADYLGFNFYPPSARNITAEAAAEIIPRLPRAVGKIALFVNEPKERIREVLAAGAAHGGSGFSGVQLHGEESAEYCLGWDVKVIKAFRVKDRDSLRAMENFPADYYLVDSWAPGYGGSGAPFPWNWLQGLSAEKLILAGGLHAGNVADAIRLVNPYGVDVCTGVETRPGIKDHEKLKAFIAAVKDA
ncbi:MAG TPA: phosphoribosylanthranilate isomerase [Verrucomicrobiae bacterium]|jgi:phosphoribosylanthranilate isomerase|nr:phosphoribosylanthranilate isomerase [Verrucomicrobiae bacterium]